MTSPPEPASRGRHPLGPALGPKGHTCGGCAWAHPAGPDGGDLRCAASGGRGVSAHWHSCRFHESLLDCLQCSACCGPAFDAVEVDENDPMVDIHPTLLTRVFNRLQIRRTTDNHCAALERSSKRCRIYGDRPRCCREFERGSDNCVWARRRLGFSPPWPANPAGGHDSR